MWVRYCRPPIGAHFHPTPQPPAVPQQLGEKDGSPLRGAARLCSGRRPPLGGLTRLVIITGNSQKITAAAFRQSGTDLSWRGGIPPQEPHPTVGFSGLATDLPQLLFHASNTKQVYTLSSQAFHGLLFDGLSHRTCFYLIPQSFVLHLDITFH